MIIDDNQVTSSSFFPQRFPLGCFVLPGWFFFSFFLFFLLPRRVPEGHFFSIVLASLSITCICNGFSCPTLQAATTYVHLASEEFASTYSGLFYFASDFMWTHVLQLCFFWTKNCSFQSWHAWDLTLGLVDFIWCICYDG